MPNEPQEVKHPLLRYCAIAATAFGALTAVVKFAEELPKIPLLTHQQKWLVHFLPDVVLAFLLSALLAFLVLGSKYDVIASLARPLQSGRVFQVTIVLLLGISIAVLIVPIAARIWALDKARILTAKFDWSYYRARESIVQGQARRALAHFERQGNTFNYLSADIFGPRLRRETEDVKARIREAEGHVANFHVAERNGTIAWADLLRLQRASVLCSDCPPVAKASQRAKARIEAAVKEYLAGIVTLRRQHWDEAVACFVRAERQCSHFLDLDLLKQYAQSRDTSSGRSEENALMHHYLATPFDEVRSEVSDHPLVSSIRNLPHIMRRESIVRLTVDNERR